MSKIITKPFLPDEPPEVVQQAIKLLPVLKESDNATEIHLSGTAITEAGKMTKHRFFEFLEMDIGDYTDLSFTVEEATKIRGQLGKMSTGHTAVVPMTCSTKCPFKDNCVFYKMGKAPFLRPCLVETNLMREWIISYMTEYEVDPNSFTEVSMINELAEIEIYLWRLSQSLAKSDNAELVETVTVGYSGDGMPLTNKQISSFLDAKERLYTRRSKIIKLMVGDRQEKYKKEAALKIKDDNDGSNSMADLRTRLERLAREVKQKEIAALEQSGKVLDVSESVTPDDLIGSE